MDFLGGDSENYRCVHPCLLADGEAQKPLNVRRPESSTTVGSFHWVNSDSLRLSWT